MAATTQSFRRCCSVAYATVYRSRRLTPELTEGTGTTTEEAPAGTRMVPLPWIDSWPLIRRRGTRRSRIRRRRRCELARSRRHRSGRRSGHADFSVLPAGGGGGGGGPVFLTGVAAVATTNAWAVGTRDLASGDQAWICSRRRRSPGGASPRPPARSGPEGRPLTVRGRCGRSRSLRRAPCRGPAGPTVVPVTASLPFPPRRCVPVPVRLRPGARCPPL